MTKNRKVSLYIYSKVGGSWKYRKAPERLKNLTDGSSYVLMWYQGEDANGKSRKRTLNVGKSADVAKIEIAKKKAELLNRIVDGKETPEPELAMTGLDTPKPVHMVKDAIEKFMGECRDRCGQDGYGFAKRSLIVYRRSLGYLREFGGEHRKGKSHHDLVFPNSAGCVEGHFLRKCQRVAKLAGLTGFELHRFRKTFATQMHEGGASVRQVQSWLGHTDLDTTLIYLGVQDSADESSQALVNNSPLAVQYA